MILERLLHVARVPDCVGNQAPNGPCNKSSSPSSKMFAWRLPSECRLVPVSKRAVGSFKNRQSARASQSLLFKEDLAWPAPPRSAAAGSSSGDHATISAATDPTIAVNPPVGC
mmetsp:Transcript_15555/g.37676  ORF Transcript_15555/g.37676 Transcript_15555/m.37676 type:complete len:113 (-) Transcript_15555:566-904(-)